MTQGIRNFAIVAHIDHGKSTLADRLIQLCGGLTVREMKAQVLDSMELERERGITIKSQAVRLHYQGYELNLVDTPGHVDFSYEVSRALAACEGALLVVDASQGIEAQTLANVYLALEHDLVIVPVLNKIDLPQANPERVIAEIEEVIGLSGQEAVKVSAKSGEGMAELLQAILTAIPAPQTNRDENLRCLVMDSWYDSYDGVIVLVRVVAGKVKRGDELVFMATQATHTVTKLGYFQPRRQETEQLEAGQIGYIIGSIKNLSDCQVGDTVTHRYRPAGQALAGFKRILPVVFCGIYPAAGEDYEHLRKSIDKLRLNDASFSTENEQSSAFGLGFRCGFLGLLHMEIIQERLRREYKLDLIVTAPSVVYEIEKKQGTVTIYSPRDIPDPNTIVAFREPWVVMTILAKSEHVGGVMALCSERRGRQVSLNAAGERMMLQWELPLNEVVFDFHDRLKSLTSGYASFDYTPLAMRDGDLVRLDILLNQEPVEEFSIIVHRQFAQSRGRQICKKLKELLPRQNYRLAIQAAIAGKVIARETLDAYRKDVTAKCYGGDVTRKRKLLEKQKAGKKRLQSSGRVEIPKHVFIKALQIEPQ